MGLVDIETGKPVEPVDPLIRAALRLANMNDRLIAENAELKRKARKKRVR